MVDQPTSNAAPASAAPSASPASPSPSSSPASEPSPSAATPSPSADERPEGNQDFAGLGQDFDDTITLEVPETPAEATPFATTTEPTPAPVPPVVKVEEPKPVVQAQPSQEPAAPAPSSPPAEGTGGGLMEQLGQHRDAIIGELASSRFALSKAEEDALELDAVAAIPTVMARVYYESVTAALNHIQTKVPLLIDHFLKVQKAQTDAEGAFFGKFPALDRGKHMGDVAMFANLFRQANPQATPDELFSAVGAAVMAKNGLTAAPPVPGVNGVVAASPQPAPFVPARAGASLRVTPDDPNPFAGLGQDFDG